jgi:coenzyme F420-reducing hydrogenase delta subunit
MKKILFLAGSFLAFSTLCLNVNASLYGSKSHEEIKKETDYYFSVFKDNYKNVVPSTFTEGQVKVLVAGMHVDEVEFSIDNKKIKINQKDSEILYNYSTGGLRPSSFFNPLHSRVTIDEKSTVKVFQQPSLEGPYSVEVKYNVIAAINNETSEIKIKIKEKNWKNNELRGLIASLFVLFAKDQDEEMKNKYVKGSENLKEKFQNVDEVLKNLRYSLETGKPIEDIVEFCDGIIDKKRSKMTKKK